MKCVPFLEKFGTHRRPLRRRVTFRVESSASFDVKPIAHPCHLPAHQHYAGVFQNNTTPNGTLQLLSSIRVTNDQYHDVTTSNVPRHQPRRTFEGCHGKSNEQLTQLGDVFKAIYEHTSSATGMFTMKSHQQKVKEWKCNESGPRSTKARTRISSQTIMKDSCTERITQTKAGVGTAIPTIFPREDGVRLSDLAGTSMDLHTGNKTIRNRASQLRNTG